MFSFRPIHKNEIPIVKSWFTYEGWSFGDKDIELMVELQPDSFWVLSRDEILIGCVSCFRYTPSFANISFLYVIPPYRRKGVGQDLIQRCCDEAVEKMRTNYTLGIACAEKSPLTDTFKKQGFQFVYKIYRLYRQMSLTSAFEYQCVAKIKKSDFLEVSVLDCKIMSFSRVTFLRKWINMNSVTTYVSRSGDRIDGYVVVRPGVQGYIVGPFFALNLRIMKNLLFKLISDFGNKEISIFVPNVNEEGLEVLSAYGFNVESKFLKMYKNALEGHDLQKIYGITSIDLG